MKLWLDDERLPPDDTWTWAKTAQEAIDLLATHTISEASLDHDLSDVLSPVRSHKEQTGYDVVLWMAEHNRWPSELVVIHSWNNVGSQRMAAVVDRYGPYETRCQHIPYSPAKAYDAYY